MSNKKFIPFSWWPAHWGLHGKVREIALAEFELSGTELLRKKIDININERTAKEQKLGHLDLDHRIKKITDYNYAKSVIKVNVNGNNKDQVKIDLLELKHKHNKIDDNELQKQKATVLKEPWVTIKTLETDPEDPKFGGVELDWNEAFVENLEKHGYGPNPSDEDTVNDWFNELCRNIALEAYAGIGDFDEQVLGDDAELRPTKKTKLHEDVIVKEPLPIEISKSGPAEDDDE